MSIIVMDIRLYGHLVTKKVTFAELTWTGKASHITLYLSGAVFAAFGFLFLFNPPSAMKVRGGYSNWLLGATMFFASFVCFVLPYVMSFKTVNRWRENLEKLKSDLSIH